MLYKYKDWMPEVADDVFIAPGAHVIGRVSLRRGSSIWFNAVVRGDINDIVIGEFTNIQDNAVIHVDPGFPTIIGDYVLVGHKAIIHGCKIGNGALIGMGAILLDGVTVGENALIAAGAVVREGTEIPAGMLAVGVPARVVRELRPEEIKGNHEVTERYIRRAQDYLRFLK